MGIGIGLGLGDGLVSVSASEVRARCDSPLFLGGALYRLNATVHPARLVLGLRAKLLARGVRIHVLTPGVVDTDMLAGRDRDALARTSLAGRLATVDEVAAAVCFLLAQHASTGDELVLDGGQLAKPD